MVPECDVDLSIFGEEAIIHTNPANEMSEKLKQLSQREVQFNLSQQSTSNDTIVIPYSKEGIINVLKRSWNKSMRRANPLKLKNIS